MKVGPQMRMPEGAVLVSEIAGKRALIKTNGYNAALTTLMSMGFKPEGTNFVRPIADSAERQYLVRKLISLNALFVGGPDWGPAELVEYYKEQGLVEENFLRIVWKSPEEYLITEC